MLEGLLVMKPPLGHGMKVETSKRPNVQAAKRTRDD
jgi:hypothetical protein